MISSTSRVSRLLSKGLLLASIALVPVLASTSASAQSKMSGGKMMHGKMSGGKMMMGHMSGSMMMMGHMTASEKRTYSNMSAKEKALMMKMMHGKM